MTFKEKVEAITSIAEFMKFESGLITITDAEQSILDLRFARLRMDRQRRVVAKNE